MGGRRLLAAITAAWIGVLLLFSLLFPVYRAPDEIDHVDLTLHVSETYDYPAFDELSLSQRTLTSAKLVRVPQRHLLGTDAPARPRPAYAELGPDERSTLPNRMLQHPPAYYLTTAAVVDAASALGADGLGHDAFVWLVRLVNIALLAPLPWLIYAASLRLTTRRGAALAAAFVPFAIPQLVHIGASANNDNLLTLLGAVLLVLGARVLRGDHSMRTAVLLGIVVGFSLFTKAFGVVFAAWVGLLYIVVWVRTRSPGLAIGRLATAGVVSFAFGGWWWLRNLVVYERLRVAVPLYDPAAPGFEPDYVFWAKRFGVWLTESFWGWMGGLEAKLPEVLIGAASVAAVTAIVVVLVRGKRTGLARGETLLLLTPMLLLALIIVAISLANYVDVGETVGIQGRYLFAGVAGFAVVLGASLPERWWAVVPGAAVVMIVAAVWVTLGTYYGPEGSNVLTSLASWGSWMVVPPLIGVLLVAVPLAVAGFLGLTAPPSGLRQ